MCVKAPHRSQASGPCRNPVRNSPGYTAMLRNPATLVLLLIFLCCGGAHAQQPPTESEVIAQGAQRLGPKDFELFYVGNTLSGSTADHEPFHVFVASRSSYRMLFQNKRSTGGWNVGKDGGFCSTADNETTCTREYKRDQTIYSFNPDGTLAGTASIRPGNPEQL